MPDHMTHRIVKELLLGTSDMDVDKLIDDPVRFLGKGHRKLFHSPRDVFMLAAFSKDPARFIDHAFIHIATDRAVTAQRQAMARIRLRRPFP